MKLALGTVQLGIPYGIANQSGMPNEIAATEIIKAAQDSGYEWLDTAAAYGQSEAVIGRLLPPSYSVSIATKFVLQDSLLPQQQLFAALQRLARPSVEALLLHQESDLDHARFSDFAALPSTGMVKRVGVSCYDPKRALQGIDAGLQCLQVPCNLFDTSSIDAGVFQRALEQDVLVFVRSIFLQGLFFLTPDHPRALLIPGATEALRFLHDFCERHAISPAELALSFGASLEDAVIILGADQASQVRANRLLVGKTNAHRDLVAQWLHERPAIAPSVIHPGKWPTAS